jgi:hypothetical protein
MEPQIYQRRMAARQRDPLSSFGRLPVELLREIVKEYLESSQSITTIMHICQHLRHVVLGMTTIWSSIWLLSSKIRPKYRYDDVGDILFVYVNYFSY